jgi:hypothetical protein
MPVNEIFTVNPLLTGSQLMVAAPAGICFSVALAVVLLIALVDDGAAVAVPGETAADVVPPHPARNNTITTLSTARRSNFRLSKYFLSMTPPFT